VNSKLNSVWELSRVVLQQEVVVFGLDVAGHYIVYFMSTQRDDVVTYMTHRSSGVVNHVHGDADSYCCEHEG